MKIIETSPRFPLMSFRDLELWIQKLAPPLIGARVQRIFVPECPGHPEGYWKNTLVMELHSSTALYQLRVSLRPQECGMVLHSGRPFRPCSSASKSGFLLGLAKSVEGSRLQEISSIPGDRIVRFRFQGHSHFELHLHLIPGRPVGVLLEKTTLLQSSDARAEYLYPAARPLSGEQIAAIPVHPEWFENQEGYRNLWEDAENASLLRLRKVRALQKIDGEMRALVSKRKSLEEQVRQTERESDWSALGSLLQANLYLRPRLEQGVYHLVDPTTGAPLSVPGDSRLSPEQQLERYFHLAKRKKRRLQDSSLRLQELETRIGALEKLQELIATVNTPVDLEPLEDSLGLRIGAPPLPSREQKKISGFSGKRFQSQEGLTILVGRNSAENLELTFKIARGNDVWLHVKGRPGSHAVILLPPNRSASLETLLDAANLCILYSGGRDWGKTEVDYTLRKNVKKIKNHTEVSYSSPKTLSVVVDSVRLKRLGDS